MIQRTLFPLPDRPNRLRRLVTVSIAGIWVSNDSALLTHCSLHADVVADLETTIKDLEQQLEASEEEAASAIAQWQETVTSLESDKKELTESLEKSEAAQQSTHAQLVSIQGTLKEKLDALAKTQAIASGEWTS